MKSTLIPDGRGFHLVASYQSAEWLTLWGLNEAARAALKLVAAPRLPRHAYA
jgi:hypothetical protein